MSKPDARGVYKWVKAHTTRKVPRGTKSYIIHDNGSSPFRVEVAGKRVAIYKGTLIKRLDGSLDYGTYEYNELLIKRTVREVHLGESTCDPASYISDKACDAETIGNSILLHLSGNKYMYVGSEIYEFTMEDDFEAYYSTIGRNDVPYPVTIGSKYVYFMLDGTHTYIPKSLFTAPMNAVEWSDAYAYYYGFKDFETGKPYDCYRKYKSRGAERLNCEKQATAKHNSIMKGKERPMKGVKMIRKRGM